MTQTTQTKTLKIVRKVAAGASRKKTQRFPRTTASFGDTIRQGDLYVTLLARVPAGAQLIAAQAQLAPGTSRGSRHALDSLDGVKMYRLPSANEFDGPILQLATERTVTHPDHGHWLLPIGVYAVSYQRNQDVIEQKARRSMD